MMKKELTFLILLVALAIGLIAGCGGTTVVVRQKEDLVKKGETALKTGKLESALDYFRQAQAAEPNNPQALYGLGRVYLAKRDAYRAEQFLRQAVEKKPDFAEAHALLGELYQARGDEKSAMEQFAKCPTGTPAWAELHLRMGKDKLDKGDRQGAREEFEKCNSVKDFWGGQWGLGEIARQMSGCEFALPFFMKAVSQKEAPDALLSCADCLKEAGRDREAYFFYMRYLAVAGECENAKRARKIIDDMSGCLSGCEVASKVCFNADVEQNVRVCVYDDKGRYIRNLFTGWITRGHYAMNWDGTDTMGVPVAGEQFWGVVVCGDSTKVMRLVPAMP